MQPEDSNSVISESPRFLVDQTPDFSALGLLSVALIGPGEESRKAAARAISACQVGEVREFSSYPSTVAEIGKLLEQQCDIVVIGLDSDPEKALAVVREICASDRATVMVYSAAADPDLLVRCMRAGVREFISQPFVESNVAEALVRSSARRPANRTLKKAGGRLLAFLGAKGGDGVTTLVCNFAVALAQESGQSTLLIDLDLPLGDAALNLGVVAQYSANNALENVDRLDSNFLSSLLVRHSSGLSVLAAPGKFPQFDASNEAIDKLLTVARQDFENVVIDMGSRIDLMGTGLFKESSTIYLVIQAGIAGLRNANRLISQYFVSDTPKLEIVLNRFQPRTLGVAEDQITKALTRPAQWKIPNDFAAVRRMQHTAIPLALEDSPISRLIRQMARCAGGLPPLQEKSSGFSLKKISRSIASKISASDEAPALAQLDLSQAQDRAEAPSSMNQPATPAPSQDARHETLVEAVVTAEEAQPPLTAGASESPANVAEARRPEQTAATVEKQPDPETRAFQGATYKKGADGRWYLQQAKTSEESASAEKKLPIIDWSAPSQVAYGAALSAAQLNASASVPGSFAYKPAMGELLPPGIHTLKANFTPDDETAYAPAQSSVSLIVTPATPPITWPAPASIAYGTALSAAQLNANAPVPGTLVYQPSAGEVLPAGEHTLSVSFTPENGALYRTAGAAVSLTVSKATPIITWPTPSAIAQGTALSAVQLNAISLVPGTLIYTPGADEVLSAGTHTLQVTFIPADTVDYTAVQATVALIVTRAARAAVLPSPDSKTLGEAFGAREPDFSPQPVRAETTARPARKSAAHRAPASPKASPKAAAQALAEVAEDLPLKASAPSAVKLAAGDSAQAATKALVKAEVPEAPIEVGPGLDLMGSAVLEDGTTIYLVMRPGDAGLASSRTLVSQFFSAQGPKPDFVVNRFEPGSQDSLHGPTSTALTKPASMPISRLIGQVARRFADASNLQERKTGLGFLKDLGRNLWAKITNSERPMAGLGLTAGQDEPEAEQSKSTVENREQAYYALAAGEQVSAADRPDARTAREMGRALSEGKPTEAMLSAGASGPETRTFMGATYAKGADGQWHLQRQNSEPAKQRKSDGLATGSAPAAKFWFGSTELEVDSVPESDKVDSGQTPKPARKTAAKKPQAKASVQKPAKPGMEPSRKAAALPPIKASAKSTAKSSSKQNVSSAAKSSLKKSEDASSGAAARISSKQPAKTAEKPVAKTSARRAMSTAKKSATSRNSKSARKVNAKEEFEQPISEIELQDALEESITGALVPNAAIDHREVSEMGQ